MDCLSAEISKMQVVGASDGLLEVLRAQKVRLAEACELASRLVELERNLDPQKSEEARQWGQRVLELKAGVVRAILLHCDGK